ncbi:MULTISPECIES: plasmid replication DNA-binding protein [unclassified Acinetobacter]|uniref:plasmid replication DNA-binding protein n=1 Tax=unclassified Acinetobacter TaxID=196816 RepID=UPI0015D1A516|nr:MULTISPECIES: plasmid replication DNA-binding protein [unclassified Acinetobacter]
MSKLTISEAAKIYNLTRGAIYDRINAGTLSTSLNERGNKVVDMADLVATYGEPKAAKTEQSIQQPTQQNSTQNDTIELYRKMLDLSESTRQKAEQREERLFNEITALREEVRELRLALGYTPKQDAEVITQQPTTHTGQAIQQEYTELHNNQTTEKETGEGGYFEKKPDKKKGLFGRLINAVFED